MNPQAAQAVALFLMTAVILHGCAQCGDPGNVPDDLNACVNCRAESENTRSTDVGAEAEQVSSNCLIDRGGGFCQTPFCRLTVEPDVFDQPTRIELTEGTPPRALVTDVLGPRTCRLGALEGASRSFTLAALYTEDEIPADFVETELVGAWIAPAFRSADAAHDTERNEFIFTVSGAAEVAVSALPAYPRLEREVGIEEFDADDPASYYRNLSRYSFAKAFHDGQRFYLANGPRVLVWEDGIPPDPRTPPDVVVGQPDLATTLEFTTASNFGGHVRGIWSDGARLAISEGHRVLIWNQVPTRNFAPADVVIGQADFTSNDANRGGGPGANTLNVPDELWSDGMRFVVADTFNNRFLIWNTFPVVMNQAADLVVGQSDFSEGSSRAGALDVFRARGVYSNGTQLAFASTYSCNCLTVMDAFPARNNASEDYRIGEAGGGRVSATSHHLPGALSRFGDAGLALRNGYRVSAWTSFPQIGDHVASITVGRPDPILGAPFGRTTAASLVSSSPNGDVWADEQRMAVADDRRVLVWTDLPGTDFTQADLVFGQPSAATNDVGIDYRGISATTLAYPADVSSAGDVTAVADRANNRVLVLRGAPASPTDVVVLGQNDGVSFAPNGDWRTPSAATLNSPAGVFTDGVSLIVADTGNHRVLIWNDIPDAHGTPADRVLGQASFTEAQQNGGSGDVDGDGQADASAATMQFPSAVFYDGELLVTDTFNHRVLVWDTLPATNGAPANRVVGQPDFVANAPNRGLGWYERSSRSLARPIGISKSELGQVAVADSENNRVLIFDQLDSDPEAVEVLGQPNFIDDVAPNWFSGANVGFPMDESALITTSSTMRRPMGLVWRPDGVLMVADTGNHRLLRFTELSTGAAATDVVGQHDPEHRTVNAGGLGAESINAAESVAVTDAGALIVADTANHRLIISDADSAYRAVFGQPVFERNGINGSTPADGRLHRPSGIEATKDGLWVADREHHRVVAFRNGEMTHVRGQLDRGGALPNAGLGDADGWTLDQPADVWTDGNQLIVADSGNHRVLIWTSIPDDPKTPADVVVGQPDHVSSSPNSGRGVTTAGADGLLAPEGVLVVGETLYVADTGNSRVLVFDELPTVHGASADRVYCQPDMTSNRPNLGVGGASASSCSGPTDTLVIGERLYVADTLNHRILGFDVAGAAVADLVLGQPDFNTRSPVDDDGNTTASIFANPTRIAYDGTNLYIVDRGNHRVLIYDRVPPQSFAPADRLIGQVSFDVSVVTPAIDGLESPSGIAVLQRPYRATTVFVADGAKDRIVEFGRVARPF